MLDLQTADNLIAGFRGMYSSLMSSSSKNSKAELSANGVPDGVPQDFGRLAVKFGFTDDIITRADGVNENSADFSTEKRNPHSNRAMWVCCRQRAFHPPGIRRALRLTLKGLPAAPL